ncbi:hypothetical protein ACSBM8_11890 [Sphingomonas sp. ASY06-1R]|uniref:hypothetical protein n=1 Tax=Sphingomonas sp. ASY06-1R TaxID=3445771 RepID=UPI003FA1A823
MPEKVIAERPFFGSVSSEDWNLVLHPPCRRGGIDYTVRFADEPKREDYDALGGRLAAFEAFCRDIEAKDGLVRHYLRSWPNSAGAFELVGVMMAGGELPLPWAVEPGRNGPDAPRYQPFALQYRALDGKAWDFAGIPWYPPLFAALFNEAGTFAGIDHQVDEAMRSLPSSIAASRWVNGYRHSYFGRCRLSELTKIGTATLAGRKIPIELYMPQRAMAVFEPEQLDPFVPLIERIETLDAKVRTEFPDDIRAIWLEERFVHGGPALRRALDNVFPGATAPDEVSQQDFAKGLKLDCARFSLSPESRSGATLTMDYRILPRRNDNELFAATFTDLGDLLDICIES